jgi:CBS domain containing-hemolysin-like protein
MAILVEEIMNRELFFLRPDEPVDDALGYLLSLGISGAPVVDAEMVPIGMLSFRDAAQADSGRRVDENMHRPVVSIARTSSIEEAARRMAETGYHRLVVTDASGKAAGLVSALDVMRGLIGLPAAHPAQFPHFDATTGLVWTDDAPLDAERIDMAPDAAGVLVLTRGPPGNRCQMVGGPDAETVP